MQLLICRNRHLPAGSATFDVHAEGCRDAANPRKYALTEGWAGDFASQLDVAADTYADQINHDNAGDPVWGQPEAYLSDFHFHNCTRALPQENNAMTTTLTIDTDTDTISHNGEEFVAVPTRGRKHTRRTMIPTSAVNHDDELNDRYGYVVADTLDDLLDIIDDDASYRVLRFAGSTYEPVLDITPAA